MQLQTGTRTLEINGGSSVSSFNIALNGKAFRVLSDTLYQNKIGSMVREISCNAYDAHVMAGKACTPFQIHLPDAFEPWFSVKDFGIGLSPEDIVNVFTVYFQSTKDQSNDTIGAFGLGAKTPFAYTDQFTVTSVKDGIRRIYSAFINESGIPGIIQMDEAHTDEQNGVEIKVSVKKQDYYNFAVEVERQLRFFKVKPLILNGKVDFPSDEVLFSSDSITVNAADYGSGINLIQGNVGYPLNNSNLLGKISNSAQEVLTSIRYFSSFIHFNIGEIGVTASREGVEYDNRTIKNIESKLLKIKAEFNDFIESSTKNCTNDWERAVVINSNKLLGTLNSVTNRFLTQFDIAKVNEGTRVTVDGTRGRIGQRITPSNTTLIAIRDASYRVIKRINIILEQNPGCSVYVVERSYKDVDDAFVATLSSVLGGANIIRLSSIEIPKQERSKVKSTVCTYYYIKYVPQTASVRKQERMFDNIEDIEEETLYVRCKNGNLTEYAMKQVSRYFALASFEENLPKVIAVREDETFDNENLIELGQYLNDKVAEYNFDPIWRKMLIRHNRAAAMQVSVDWEIRNNPTFKNVAKQVPDNELCALVNIMNDAVLKYILEYTMLSKYNRIAQFCGFNCNKNDERIREKFGKKVQKAIDKYPFAAVYCKHHAVSDKVSVDHLKSYLASM